MHFSADRVFFAQKKTQLTFSVRGTTATFFGARINSGYKAASDQRVCGVENSVEEISTNKKTI